MTSTFTKHRSYEGLPGFTWFRSFDAAWTRLGLADADAIELERALHMDPEAGVVVAGTNGIRKVRFSPSSLAKGKSGAFRVFYLNVPDHGRFYMIALLSKTEDANLTKADRNGLAALVAELKRRKL